MIADVFHNRSHKIRTRSHGPSPPYVQRGVSPRFVMRYPSDDRLHPNPPSRLWTAESSNPSPSAEERTKSLPDQRLRLKEPRAVSEAGPIRRPVVARGVPFMYVRSRPCLKRASEAKALLRWVDRAILPFSKTTPFYLPISPSRSLRFRSKNQTCSSFFDSTWFKFEVEVCPFN